ncbi:MAG: hypothetical protein Q8P83_00485 [bacterium]|nr:hypothetical protein [bacterium]
MWTKNSVAKQGGQSKNEPSRVQALFFYFKTAKMVGSRRSVMDPNQLAASLELWKSLRQETLYFVGQLDLWMWRLFFWTGVLIGVSFFDSVIDERLCYAVVLASVLSVASPYVLARYEALLHRPAPAVKALENTMGIQGWENHFKPTVKPLSKFLPPLDFVMVVPLTLLFWYATRQASVVLALWWFQPLGWLMYIGGWIVLVSVLIRAASLMSAKG